jgi:hypothetical protein
MRRERQVRRAAGAGRGGRRAPVAAAVRGGGSEGLRHRRRPQGRPRALLRPRPHPQPPLPQIEVSHSRAHKLDVLVRVFFLGGLTALKLVLVPWRAGECRKAGAMTNEEAVVLAVKETVRYGLFLGTFAGSYVSVDEYIAAVWGRKRSVHGTITV